MYFSMSSELFSTLALAPRPNDSCLFLVRLFHIIAEREVMYYLPQTEAQIRSISTCSLIDPPKIRYTGSIKTLHD